MLEFLAGPAGTGLVARHLAVRRRCGLRRGRRFGGRLRFGLAQLDMAEHHCHRLAEAGKQPLEHGEGLALVFVQRVLLRVGAKGNALAKLVEAEEMLFHCWSSTWQK